MALLDDIAEKLRDPEQVKRISSQNRHPAQQFMPCWDDLSLANGYPALVLFYSSIADEKTLHTYVKAMVKAINMQGVRSPSLFTGLAGICFALSHTRYERLHKTLHEQLLKMVESYYIPLLEDDLATKRFSWPFLYDLIQGGTGVSLYLLSHEPHQALFDLLLRRCEPGDDGRPGWFTPYELLMSEQDKKEYIRGRCNYSMAHGAAGLLSLFAQAMMRGVQHSKLRSVLSYIVSCLMDIQLTKMSWCSGKPGLIRSLYLAAQALNDQTLLRFAHQSYKELCETECSLISPSLCHGLSGLYVATKLMAEDTKDRHLHEKAFALRDRILQCYDARHPFGFQDIEPLVFSQNDSPHLAFNRAGFLDGTVGITLSLLDTKQWITPLALYAAI